MQTDKTTTESKQPLYKVLSTQALDKAINLGNQ